MQEGPKRHKEEEERYLIKDLKLRCGMRAISAAPHDAIVAPCLPPSLTQLTAALISAAHATLIRALTSSLTHSNAHAGFYNPQLTLARSRTEQPKLRLTAGIGASPEEGSDQSTGMRGGQGVKEGDGKDQAQSIYSAAAGAVQSLLSFNVFGYKINVKAPESKADVPAEPQAAGERWKDSSRGGGGV